MLPEWAIDELRRLAQDSVNTQVGAWTKAMRVGRLLDPELFPPRSPQRKVLQQQIMEQGHCGRESQRRYRLMYEVLTSESDEPTIPTNIDFSTAFEIVKRGGGLDIIRQANAEGWTLKQARAWGLSREMVRESRPKSLWRYMTKRVDSDIRKSTGPLTEEQTARLLWQVRQAAQEFGQNE